MENIVFVDRDGVICENRPDHVKCWDEFVFLPGALEALAQLKRIGYPVVVITNQGAVGRGLMDVATLHDIHHRMVMTVRKYGGDIEKIYYCPHHPDEGCECRKPNTGMLRLASDQLNINLSKSYLIGDAGTDIEAGQAVGSHCILVLTGRGMAQLPIALRRASKNFQVVPNLKVA
ncbi:MAG: D-glycero-beta-D-manno-heptose 1,7-bisphosphate 7-phosphatase, partial [Anaerolineae bacterium]|nr:D-glycero-beta-D-manno-heptose 1,7-bisphosphate 7-phosphatase [Anaerolineae bacterium]